MDVKRAVVLLSGGIDSTTTLAIAREEGYEIFALTFSYGQRHSLEVERASLIASHLKVKDHKVINIDLRSIGGSALTADMEVPKGRSMEEITAGIPDTYVPARNVIFLSFALAWAERIGADTIFFGANVLDYSGYPDCRPEFIRAFEDMANLATRISTERGKKITIRAPLINMTKGAIIRKGLSLGVDFSMTHSCYDPSPEGLACGKCDSCLIRKKGFMEAGIEDPTGYGP